jgi:hypothetical protein
MKQLLIAIGIGLAALMLVLGLTWVGQGNDFFLYKVFAPKYEQARRETFEQSKAYNDGMVQEIRAMQYQYVQADASHKQALASIILHRLAGYPEENLPGDLRAFVSTLHQGISHAY